MYLWLPSPSGSLLAKPRHDFLPWYVMCFCFMSNQMMLCHFSVKDLCWLKIINFLIGRINQRAFNLLFCRNKNKTKFNIDQGCCNLGLWVMFLGQHILSRSPHNTSYSHFNPKCLRHQVPYSSRTHFLTNFCLLIPCLRVQYLRYPSTQHIIVTVQYNHGPWRTPPETSWPVLAILSPSETPINVGPFRRWWLFCYNARYLLDTK